MYKGYTCFSPASTFEWLQNQSLNPCIKEKKHSTGNVNFRKIYHVAHDAQAVSTIFGPPWRAKKHCQ